MKKMNKSPSKGLGASFYDDVPEKGKVEDAPAWYKTLKR